jgi:hypothetical protein
MNFLKKLFGGMGAPQRNPAADFYVRPKHCQEVVHVRVDLYNEPSLSDDGTYFLRKIVRAVRCPFPAELHLYFDQNRKLVNTEVIDGELVTAADYEAWTAKAP